MTNFVMLVQEQKTSKNLTFLFSSRDFNHKLSLLSQSWWLYSFIHLIEAAFDCVVMVAILFHSFEWGSTWPWSWWLYSDIHLSEAAQDYSQNLSKVMMMMVLLAVYSFSTIWQGSESTTWLVLIQSIIRESFQKYAKQIFNQQGVIKGNYQIVDTFTWIQVLSVNGS